LIKRNFGAAQQADVPTIARRLSDMVQVRPFFARVRKQGSRRLRILVTGAAGFIGAVLVRRLLDANHEVHALLKSGSKRWRLEGVLQHLYLPGLVRDSSGRCDPDQDVRCEFRRGQRYAVH